jgi:hypothetical protein
MVSVKPITDPEGQPLIVLRAETPTGSFVLFLGHKQAGQIGDALVELSGQRVSGLVVPTIDLSKFKEMGL